MFALAPECHDFASDYMSGSGVDRALVPTTSTGRNWDSRDGHDGESMIIRGRRKSVTMSHSFQWYVAKTIHLSGMAVTSATGRMHPPSLGAAVTAISVKLPLVRPRWVSGSGRDLPVAATVVRDSGCGRKAQGMLLDDGLGEPYVTVHDAHHPRRLADRDGVLADVDPKKSSTSPSRAVCSPPTGTRGDAIPAMRGPVNPAAGAILDH
jgi:hypothetical protein